MKNNIYLVSIILIALFSINFAQNEISQMRVIGNGEYLPSELIAATKTDANGEKCAGLIILTDLPDLNFTSYNQIVEITKLPGKYFLYISPDERVVEVFSNEHAPLKIILSNYGISLKSGQVWQLQITGEKKSNLIPITIIKNQPDAFVYIDGELKGTEKTQIVSPGVHEIRITKTGYKTITDKINVSKSNVYFEYNMESVKLIAATFRSIPTQAKIFINNAERGLTDFGDYFYPGKYKVRIIKSGYLDFEEEINITENGNNNFTYKLIKNSSLLIITVNPRDAEIKINDQLYTQKRIELKPGQYSIELFKAGYLPKTEMITLNLGDTLRKSYKLLKNAAILNLTVYPKDVTVLLNKKDYSNKSSIELAPGMYKLEISKEGYYPVSEPIELKLGDKISKTYSLVQKVGSLRFTIRPLNAKVELKKGNQTIQVWEGMNQILDLPVGSYTLISKAKGYKTNTKNIIINENNVTSENVTLDEGNDFVSIYFDLDKKYELWLGNKSQGFVNKEKRSLEIGKYLVRLSNNEEVIGDEIYIDDSGSNTLHIESDSRFPIVLQSALIPGLGQFTNNRVGYGITYFAAFGGAAAWHYLNFKNYYNLKGELETKVNRFNSTNSQSEKYLLGNEINKLTDEVNKEYDKAKLSFWFSIGIYLINILDAITSPTPKHIVLSNKKDIKIMPNFVIDHNGFIRGGVILNF